ncbi:hypothetical protein NQZ68_033789 [Dissostichus eleginoides]|nr:hypothetical protein NQZ68_033789 [Dissostichus eleginoides]
MLHVAFEPIVVSRVTSVPCAGDGAACAWRDKGGGPGSGSSSREPRTTVFILTKKTTTILGFQLRSPAGKQNEDTVTLPGIRSDSRKRTKTTTVPSFRF